MIRRAYLVALSVLLASSAASGASSPGTTAAEFLRFPVGARAGALGGAYVALADDVWAMHYNPGGLGLLGRPEVGAMYQSRFLDVDVSQAGAVSPWPVSWGGAAGRSLGLGASVLYLGASDVRRATPGTALGTFRVEDLAVSGGAGWRWGERLGIGVVGRYLSSTLDDRRASTGSADLGVLYRLSDRLSFGAAVQHMGGRLRFFRAGDPLPRTVRVGAAVRLLEDRLVVAADAVFTRDQDAEGAVGAEYRLSRSLFLRGGIRLNDDFDVEDRFTAGFGLAFGRLGLDYAYAPFGLLGDEHRVSLGYGWGEGEREVPIAIPSGPVPPSVPAPAPAAVPPPRERLPVPAAEAAMFAVHDVRGHPEGGILAGEIVTVLRAEGRTAVRAPAPDARFTIEPILDAGAGGGLVRLSAIVGDRSTGVYRVEAVAAASPFDAARALARKIAAGGVR